MQPIVSFCESPKYQLSKYLKPILQRLTNINIMMVFLREVNPVECL